MHISLNDLNIISGWKCKSVIDDKNSEYLILSWLSLLLGNRLWDYMEDSVLSSDWPLRPVECAICKEVLRDPRILPCGHLFCGSRHSNEEIEGCSFDLEPGNRISCLRKLVVNNEEIDEEERSSGSITHVKCALCNRNYHIDLERLAPMYGIREFLDSVRRGHVNITENKALIKNQTNKDKYLKKGMEVICVYHAPLPVEFQCMNCEGEQMLCKLCFEEDHFGHPVRLKASLDQEVFVQTMDTLDIAETRMRYVFLLRLSSFSLFLIHRK